MVSGGMTIVLAAVAVLSGDLDKQRAFDWQRTDEVRPGVKLVKFELEQPRLMKASCLRCDLKGHKFGFAATRRSKDYGKKFSAENRKCTEHTQRQSTRDWIRDNPEIVVAVNASPWCGGVNLGERGKMPAEINGFSMTYGELLSEFTIWTNVNFVIRRDGTPDIVCAGKKALPAARRKDILHAFMSYGVVLKDGVIHGNRQSLAPRTAYGYSKDRRYLYLLVVDGRQQHYSEGANCEDLGKMLRLLGASDGVNMDGGGSSALLCRDPKTGNPVQYNQHDPFGFYARPVALNFGLVEK